MSSIEVMDDDNMSSFEFEEMRDICELYGIRQGKPKCDTALYGFPSNIDVYTFVSHLLGLANDQITSRIARLNSGQLRDVKSRLGIVGKKYSKKILKKLINKKMVEIKENFEKVCEIVEKERLEKYKL